MSCLYKVLNDDKLADENKIKKRAKKGKPYPLWKLFKLSIDCPIIKETLAAVKAIVTYFKQTTLNSKLSHTLRQDVATRWDSELRLLESYVKVKLQVETALLERREFDRLINIDSDKLDELIKFLQPIRKCSETLTGDKYPTIHLVAMSLSLLRGEIKIKKTDSDEMKILKRHSANCFDQFLVNSNILLIARRSDFIV